MNLNGLVSNYTVKQFKVTFLDANGKVIEIQYVDAFEDASIDSPVLEGYTFSSWVSSDTSIIGNSSVIPAINIFLNDIFSLPINSFNTT